MFQDLVDTARMLKGRVLLVTLRGTLFIRLVRPALGAVLVSLVIPPRKQPLEILGIAKVFPQDDRGIRIVPHVLAELSLLFEHVVNQSAEQDDVRAGTERDPEIRHRGGAAETRVDMDDTRPAFPRLD